MNLYTVMAIGRVPIEEASKAVAPYFFLYLLVMILVALFPFIAAWLPTFVMG
jgi:TRAP-type C4-dicarboxylate transport system permease large subunit